MDSHVHVLMDRINKREDKREVKADLTRLYKKLTETGLLTEAEIDLVELMFLGGVRT